MRSEPEGVPQRVQPDSGAVPDILRLVQGAFAYMDSRIDPPSSMHRLTVESIASACRDGEVWVIGDPPVACVFLKKRGTHLYVGKLAVTEVARGRGFARKLLEHAETRAGASGLIGLELETRIELVENHVAFQRLGFVKVGEGAHPGYDRPTYITMQKSFATEASGNPDRGRA